MSDTFFATPADVIAAAPALLGFAPTNSVLAYLLRRDIRHGLLVRCALRFDVTVTVEQAARVPATCGLAHPDNAAAILLAVCDPGHDTHARHVLDALRDGLRDNGIHVLARLHTRDVTTAGHWLDVDTAVTGPTYPYTDSILTARQVHDGHCVSAARADIEAEFAPVAPAAPVEIGDHATFVSRTCEEIAAVLVRQRTPSPSLPTRAGALITGHPAVRDAMLGLALDHPQPAADLWTQIARQLRGRPRAEALAVAGVCFCLLGDTVRGGIAVDAALHEATHTHTPAPRLALLMDAVLRSGLDPHRIRAAVAASAPRPDADH